MSKADKAVQYMLEIASDDTHGYDQASRWGTPDYDCSSLVIDAWERAGVPVKSNGATYTGNMKRVFLANGFSDVTAMVNRQTGGGLLRGDVLLNEKSHTAMYVGGGQIVHASGNVWGGAVGGQKGDQTGREITKRGYYNSPWDVILRYTAGEEPQAEPTSTPPIVFAAAPELLYGYANPAVEALQALLLLRGEPLPMWGIDGDFGGETEKALKEFQRKQGLLADGICGQLTWAKLINGGKE